MNPKQASWLRSLLPPEASVSQRERFRAGVGALVGIAFTGMVSALVLDSAAAVVWLIAPMGASAVLIFGLPASPLAQPWSVVGGNLVAALIGVTCAKLIEVPVAAAAAAIFFAVGAMFALRCLHPPSGAVALIAVLGGPEIHAAGFSFVATPVALNTVLLLAAALLYNNATGRRYPHAQRAEAQPLRQTADLVPTSRLSFDAEDLQRALKSYDQVLDVSIDDLQNLFHETESNAFRRRFRETRCVEIMSRDVVAVEFATELAEAWELMRTHSIQALPVVDRARRVIGIVTRSDFLQHADLRDQRSIAERLRRFLARTPHSHSDKHEVVGQIMSAPAKTAHETTPAVDLVPLMADEGYHHVPIIDAERRLVGMVTQTDLVAALYEICLAQPGASRAFAA